MRTATLDRPAVTTSGMTGLRCSTNGERARPEGAGQLATASLGSAIRASIRRSATCTISGSLRGAALGAEDLAAGRGVEGVGSQAIDRLGGNGHKSAAPQDPRQPAQVLRSAAVDLCGERSKEAGRSTDAVRPPGQASRGRAGTSGAASLRKNKKPEPRLRPRECLKDDRRLTGPATCGASA